VLCMLRDPLLTPALDAGEIGLGKINGHPARLSVDIGQVSAQGRLRDCGPDGDLARLWPRPWSSRAYWILSANRARRATARDRGCRGHDQPGKEGETQPEPSNRRRRGVISGLQARGDSAPAAVIRAARERP
jgi:hypothetical protein